MIRKLVVFAITLTLICSGGWLTGFMKNVQLAHADPLLERASGQIQATSFPLITEFGLTTQLSWHVQPNPWLPSHNTLSSFVMNTVLEEGAGTVRLLFPWRNMETTQGNIDWTVQDIYVNAAFSRGLKIHTMFYGVPAWSNNTAGCDFWTQQCSAKPSSPTHFYNFVHAVAEHYGSKISTWELWNEPDLRVFWGGNMAELRDYITDPGIAAVNDVPGTNRVFVSPGISANKDKMTAFLGLTGGDWDFIGVHLFPHGNPDPYNWAVAKMTAYHTAKQTLTNSNKNVPFFITETGIGTGEGYTEMQLADYACKVVQSVRWNGTQGDMRASHAIIFYPEEGPPKSMGVSYQDFSRRPVFYDIQDQLSPLKVFIPCGNSV